MESEIRNALDQYLRDTLFYEDLPGLAVGVALGRREFEYCEAVGYKDFITKEPLEAAHIFHMASVTKLFVGTGVMLLWERGKLKLEALAADILPYLYIDDRRYKKMTVFHLLTHTAGLPDVEDYGWDRPETDEDALSRYVRSDEVAGARLLWEPGEGGFRYSNMGYEILGCIIAEAAGMSFEEYVAEMILGPLGMEDSTLLTFERTAEKTLALEALSGAGLAMPHIKDEQKHIVKEAQYPYNRAHGPSSTLTSNLPDIKKWAEAHLNQTLLKPETYNEIWKPRALVPNNGEQVGLSWFIREQNGYTLYGHEGNDDGFRASFWICPALSAHVTVLANLSKAPVKKIGKKIFDIVTSCAPKRE